MANLVAVDIRSIYDTHYLGERHPTMITCRICWLWKKETTSSHEINIHICVFIRTFKYNSYMPISFYIASYIIYCPCKLAPARSLLIIPPIPLHGLFPWLVVVLVANKRQSPIRLTGDDLLLSTALYVMLSSTLPKTMWGGRT